MIKNSTKTALFLFTNTPFQESCIKGFTPKRDINLRISQALVDHAIHLARRSRIDYYIIDSAKQKGTNFGQRLGNAFQSIFDKGYEKVISIGNDCPALTSQILQLAIQKAVTNEMVLGPTIDGGVYLIGLSKKSFNKVAFISIAWKSDQVFEQLKNLRLETNLVLLPKLADADNGSDLIKAISRYGLHPILLIIKDFLLPSSFIKSNRLDNLIGAAPQFSFGLKAPPIN